MTIAQRRVLITDERYGHGLAQLLAWNVTVRGAADWAQYLVRTSDGRYLLHTINSRPVANETVVVLIHEQASTCYRRMPVRLAEFDPSGSDEDSVNDT